MYSFHINQFHVTSEIALPCDHRVSHGGGAPLRIYLTADAELAPRSSSTTNAVSNAPLPESEVRFRRVCGAVLLDVADRITLRVDEGGQEIGVRAADEDLPEAALYILGAALALCTALRGAIPLHASSVELDGQRIGFMAPSGTGKSTTLWEFLQAGARFANDDLIPVHLENGRAFATSSVSLFPKIGRDLKARFPNASTAATEILPGRGKFWLPIAPEQRASQFSALAALFALQPYEANDANTEIVIEPLRGVPAIAHLAANSMTGTLLPAILGSQRLMSGFADLSAAVPVYAVHYPKCFAALPELVREVRQVLATQISR